MKVLGLDIGTTTISAVVVEKSVLLDRITCKNDSFLPSLHVWERIQSPEYIKETALDAVNTLLKKHPDVARIGVTGQMHGIVYLDAEGIPVSPLYTWQDGRGNLPYQDGMTYVQYLSGFSGSPLATGYGLVTHFYNAANGLVPKNAEKLCTIHDYIAMILAGKRVPVTDCTDGASLGFFDVKAHKFDVAALKKLDMDTDLLPAVSHGCIGCFKGSPHIGVYAALGDNQASFLGATGGNRGAVLINVGTGGQFSAFTEDFLQCEGLETRPFPGSGYLLVGASLCGGRAYALLESFYRSIAEACGCNISSCYEVMNKLLEAESTPQDLPVITPLFQGTRSDPTLRGSITNLNSDNFTPAHITWAMLEGMAKELYGMYRIYLSAAANTPNTLVGSGNGLRKNRPFQEIVSRQFDLPITMSACEEEAAVGAALYAASV